MRIKQVQLGLARLQCDGAGSGRECAQRLRAGGIEVMQYERQAARRGGIRRDREDVFISTQFEQSVAGPRRAGPCAITHIATRARAQFPVHRIARRLEYVQEHLGLAA